MREEDFDLGHDARLAPVSTATVHTNAATKPTAHLEVGEEDLHFGHDARPAPAKVPRLGKQGNDQNDEQDDGDGQHGLGLAVDGALPAQAGKFRQAGWQTEAMTSSTQQVQHATDGPCNSITHAETNTMAMAMSPTHARTCTAR